jgi:hypothetical protein
LGHRDETFMSYRPQFLYPTPDEYRDEDFTHYYDTVTNLALSNALSHLSAGQMILGVPLQLDTDAAFFWRGLKVIGPASYAVRFRDPYGNYLSDDFVPLPLNAAPNLPAVFGTPPVILDPEIACVAGGVILVDIKRLN